MCLSHAAPYLAGECEWISRCLSGTTFQLKCWHRLIDVGGRGTTTYTDSLACLSSHGSTLLVQFYFLGVILSCVVLLPCQEPCVCSTRIFSSCSLPLFIFWSVTVAIAGLEIAALPGPEYVIKPGPRRRVNHCLPTKSLILSLNVSGYPILAVAPWYTTPPVPHRARNFGGASRPAATDYQTNVTHPISNASRVQTLYGPSAARSALCVGRAVHGCRAHADFRGEQLVGSRDRHHLGLPRRGNHLTLCSDRAQANSQGPRRRAGPQIFADAQATRSTRFATTPSPDLVA